MENKTDNAGKNPHLKSNDNCSGYEASEDIYIVTGDFNVFDQIRCEYYFRLVDREESGLASFENVEKFLLKLNVPTDNLAAVWNLYAPNQSNISRQQFTLIIWLLKEINQGKQLPADLKNLEIPEILLIPIKDNTLQKKNDPVTTGTDSGNINEYVDKKTGSETSQNCQMSEKLLNPTKPICYEKKDDKVATGIYMTNIDYNTAKTETNGSSCTTDESGSCTESVDLSPLYLSLQQSNIQCEMVKQIVERFKVRAQNVMEIVLRLKQHAIEQQELTYKYFTKLSTFKDRSRMLEQEFEDNLCEMRKQIRELEDAKIQMNFNKAYTTFNGYNPFDTDWVLKSFEESYKCVKSSTPITKGPSNQRNTTEMSISEITNPFVKTEEYASAILSSRDDVLIKPLLHLTEGSGENVQQSETF